jgi:predicted MPP superfamily phosphohydrolase
MKDENILDLILIDGDVGYDLDTNNCKNYESFLLLLSRIAKFVPVIIVTGNHEYNTPDNFLLF